MPVSPLTSDPPGVPQATSWFSDTTSAARSSYGGSQGPFSLFFPQQGSWCSISSQMVSMESPPQSSEVVSEAQKQKEVVSEARRGIGPSSPVQMTPTLDVHRDNLYERRFTTLECASNRELRPLQVNSVIGSMPESYPSLPNLPSLVGTRKTSTLQLVRRSVSGRRRSTSTSSEVRHAKVDRLTTRGLENLHAGSLWQKPSKQQARRHQGTCATKSWLVAMSFMAMLAVPGSSVLMHHLPTMTVRPWLLGLNTALIIAYLAKLGATITQCGKWLLSIDSFGKMLDIIMVFCLLLEILLVELPVYAPSQIFEILAQCKAIAASSVLLDICKCWCKPGQHVSCHPNNQVDRLSMMTVMLLVLAGVFLSSLEPVLWSQGRDATKLTEAMLANYSSQVGSEDILQTLRTVFGSRLMYIEVDGVATFGDPSVVPLTYHSTCTSNTDGSITICIKRANMQNNFLYLFHIIGIIFVVLFSSQCLTRNINAMLADRICPTNGVSQGEGCSQDIFTAINGEPSAEHTNRQTTEYAAERASGDSPVLIDSIQTDMSPRSLVHNAQDFFLQAMSHELRTPFACAITNAELLLEQGPPMHHQKILEDIILGCTRGLIQVSNLITYTKLQMRQVKVCLECFDIGELVQATIESVKLQLQQKQKHIHFRMLVGASKYVGDKHKLQQILQHVLHNAILHNPSETEITVVVSHVTSTVLQNDWPGMHAMYDFDSGLHPVLIEVTDQGVGTPTGVLEYCAPFKNMESKSTRNTQQGSGLGLFICKSFANLLGASIKISSPATLDLRALPQQSSSSNTPTMAIDTSIMDGYKPESSFSPTTLATDGNQASQRGTRVSILMALRPSNPRGVLQTGCQGYLSHTDDPTDPQRSTLLTNSSNSSSLLESHMTSDQSCSRQPYIPGQCNNKADSCPELLEEAFMVLVVEDTKIIARALETQLRHLGCSVVICENGEKALQHLNDSPGAWYDLIFMDYHMPVMDGIECTHGIRTLEKEGRSPGKPAMHIVGHSADDSEFTLRQWAAAGMDSFRSKPLPIDDLRTLVESQRARLGRRKKVAPSSESLHSL
mmetsp:Transcript_151020/g.263908  ORF Transcript_151020/g.263908 Transcript_151020/m.263908 type:complete len:1066 (-) Transcript_151020:121-3318(-)